MQISAVTLAHTLPAELASALGVSLDVKPGTRVDVPTDQVRRLWSAGLLADASLEAILGSSREVLVSTLQSVSYTGPNRPEVPAGTPYVWFQTGVGSSGTGTAIWIEDGR